MHSFKRARLPTSVCGMCAGMCVPACTYVCACVRAGVFRCVRAGVRACMCVRACVCVHAYLCIPVLQISLSTAGFARPRSFCSASRCLLTILHNPNFASQVKDSAEDVKRSFLDRKGLTMAEVDEAFRRVLPTQQQAPVPPPSPAQGSSGLVTYQQQQPQPGQPTQQSQQQGPLPAQQSSHGYNLVPSAGQQGGMLVPIAQPQLPPPHEPLRWSQVGC